MSAIPQHRKSLGQRIRAKRLKAKLTQEKLAEKADLSTVFISDLKRGKENVSVDSLLRIARVLQIRVRNLIRDF